MTDNYNLDTKTYTQLKDLCDELDLPKNGSTAALKARIQEELETKEIMETPPFDDDDLPEEPEVVTAPTIPAPTAPAKKELKLIIDTDEITKQAVDLDPELQAHIRRAQTAKKKDDLLPMIKDIFAGRATVEYVDQGDTSQGFAFKGGPRKNHYVTIHQPERLILRYAQEFVARVDARNMGNLGY